MVILDGNSLKIMDVYRVAVLKEKVSLGEEARDKIKRSYERLLEIVKQNKPVYGINTGFGIFANQIISITDSKQLNRNLILSHSVGTGDLLSSEYVRAAILIRVNALAKGYSGIKIEIVETLIEMLNKDVTPAIQDKGSLGSSGDLCMLAQLALVLSRDEKDSDLEPGDAFYQGELQSGSSAMKKAGLERQVLSYKDGLALINGATFSAAIMALCIYEAKFMCDLADIATALSLEALLGISDAFHPVLHKVRGLKGQIRTAKNILRLIKGSSLVNSHPHVQDAYSLRCSPQVHGAVRDTIENVELIISKEINAATDNPLIIADGVVLSGGNFHGEPVGIFADHFSIAISELAAISERRIFRMIDSSLNYGLPQMLVDDDAKAGLNSGIMMLQYTAAALVLENQTLASPDSVRSLPTSANQEDHNANAYNAAFHSQQIINNAYKVLVIELLCACRAIDLRKKINKSLKLGEKTQMVYELIRTCIPYIAEDSVWGKEINILFNKLRFDGAFRETISNCNN